MRTYRSDGIGLSIIGLCQRATSNDLWLKFISYFLEEHLDEELESHLPWELFEDVKGLVLSYEDLFAVRRFDAEAVSGLRPERSVYD